MIAIKVKNLTKIYKLYDHPQDRLKESLNPFRKKYHRDFYALRDISFEIKKGETVGIIGKNGSGKSTLLKLITGVLTPTLGEISVSGSISALLELGGGFNPEFTGIENIYLSGIVMGFTKHDMDLRLEKILSFADIGDFASQPVKIYSSGMFVRLAFAVAINVNPEVLIIDEALAVGDINFQLKCYNKFNEFRENGKTILFVSHSMDSILKYCSKVIVLNNGSIVEQGSPNTMVDIYKKILVDCYDNKLLLNNVKEETVWKNNVYMNPDYLSYGNKDATIQNFALIDKEGNIISKVIKGEEFSIKMKVLFHKTIDNPIFAYTIKNIKGTEITGTNTTIEDLYTGKYENGQVAIVTFKQTLNLQPTFYSLSLGCTNFENDEFVVYHRLYDVCTLEIIGTKYTVGFFDPQSKIELDSGDDYGL